MEQIIRQAQHNFLRLRTMYVIDQLALEYKDPLIMSHWSLFNSATESSVRINIITQGYDMVSKLNFYLNFCTQFYMCFFYNLMYVDIFSLQPSMLFLVTMK